MQRTLETLDDRAVVKFRPTIRYNIIYTPSSGNVIYPHYHYMLQFMGHCLDEDKQKLRKISRFPDCVIKILLQVVTSLKQVPTCTILSSIGLSKPVTKLKICQSRILPLTPMSTIAYSMGFFLNFH